MTIGSFGLHCIASLVALFLVVSSAAAIDRDSIKVGGAYLGMINSLKQDNRTAMDSRRNQFDTNVDVEWSIHPNINGIVQLQMGPGEGSIGIVGPGAEVTDLNIEFSVDLPNITLTIV